MAKKLTPQEFYVRSLILRLIEIHRAKTLAPRSMGELGPQHEMATAIGVPRETMNRWLNWQIKPRGLSVVAIERYLEKMEDK